MKIEKVNRHGIELRIQGSWCSIVKPVSNPTGPIKNVVFHVGKPKYIANCWNRQFAGYDEIISPVEFEAQAKFLFACYRNELELTKQTNQV